LQHCEYQQTSSSRAHGPGNMIYAGKGRDVRGFVFAATNRPEHFPPLTKEAPPISRSLPIAWPKIEGKKRYSRTISAKVWARRWQHFLGYSTDFMMLFELL
jgi:hypothetical protein